MTSPAAGGTSSPDTPEAGSRRSAAPRWLLSAIALLAVAALAFGIGRFSAFGTTPAAPDTTSADAGFARDMQVHHAQAVEMAMIVQRSTADDELRVLSHDIATGQAAQSGQLFQWLAGWGLPQSGGRLMVWMEGTDAHGGHGATPSENPTDAELHAQMGMATDDELAALRAAASTPGSRAADCQFLSLMIRHHEGAIDMVDAVVELGTTDMVGIARNMGQLQSGEIKAMQSIATRLSCAG